MNSDEIIQKIQAVKLWYHSIDLCGHITPGMLSISQLQERAELIPPDLTGKSVLDIGAWDGYFSFLAEQRGASRVLAIDSLSFGAGGKQAGVEKLKDQSADGFRVAKEILGSKVEYRMMDLYDLEELDETFDIVFLFEVHHHLWDPILGLRIVSEKCRECLLIDGDVLMTPLKILVPDTFDPTSAWRLSEGCLMTLLNRFGFSNIIPASIARTSIFSLGPISMDSGLMLSFATGRAFLRCYK